MSDEITRLQEIKAIHAVGKVVVQGMLPSNHLRHKDIEWLIEQAERAERMEMMYENTGSIMNRRHQINKIEKYEKALKEIADEGHSYLGEVARFCINTARTALGEEKLK
jgi:predicted naringenin-chalcone synthase